MVKYDNKWGTVCDDDFELTDAQAACNTLGFSGGSYRNEDIGGWGVEDCSHGEDVLLTCT